MAKSIRSELMEKLGIEKDEVAKLIATYARNHSGNVNVTEIVRDVEKIASQMIYGLGTIYKDYDVRHEILDCGKDRQEDGIMSLLDEEEQQLALSYLTNRYAENVNTWALTFYHATQKQLLEILDGGIDSYRKFVDKLPYQNINRVARTYGIESEVAEFLAANGQPKDFQQFMTDVQPVRDQETELMEQYVSNWSGKTERKSCPQNLSRKIFQKLQEEMQEKGTVSFDRENIMRGLATIHNNKQLSETEKEQLQDLFITHSLYGEVDDNFIRLARTGASAQFDTLREYLEMSPNATWDEKQHFLTERVLPASELSIQNSYNTLLTTLAEKAKTDELTPAQIMTLIRESSLSRDGKNYMRMLQDEKTKGTKLLVSIAHPVIRGESMDIELNGTTLKEIIDKANHSSLSEANRQLEEFTQSGIGEISVSSNWKTDNRFRYSSENVIGVIGDEDNSPYLTGGELSDNAGLTDLQVKCPYDIISDMMYIQSQIAEMTPEQIEKFNHRSEPVEVKEHHYRYGRVDGYYSRTVYDFEINGEKYHIKGADWTNGGRYTVVWRGEEENYPETAMGLSSSYSEWARHQSGVNIDSVIEFINQNPNRFSKFLDEHAKGQDCCGLFPAPHIERLCRDIMRMETESELKKAKEQDMQYPDEAFLGEVVGRATAKKVLTEQEKGAQDLLAEYEQLDPNKDKSISDD